MGSLRLGGVLFMIYPKDHLPPHAHGRYAGIDVIVELGPNEPRLADRRGAVSPANAKRSDVVYILTAAKQHREALNLVWEKTHD